jgi:hypothetical protein
MIFTQHSRQWTSLQNLPIYERVLPLPEEVRAFVHEVNVLTGLTAIPEKVEPDARLRADLDAALRGMPQTVLDQVAPLLLGICLGRDLGSSGASDIVADASDGSILGCVVMLDIDRIAQHSANSWATWKENLPFVIDAGFSIEATIAEPEHDTRANAIQYLLLHEFGHVLTAGGTFLPRWWEAVPDADFPYLALSWQATPEQRFLPHPGSDFALRAAVNFYGDAKLDSDAILTTYTGLELSDFPSLYGATNPYDDFAECFASYVHQELLQRPYVLTIAFDGEPQARLDNFWTRPRSAPKRAFMRSLLAAT